MCAASFCVEIFCLYMHLPRLCTLVTAILKWSPHDGVVRCGRRHAFHQRISFRTL